MKRNILAVSLTAAALSFSALAMAQPRPGDGPGHDDRHGEPSRQVKRGGPGHDNRGPQFNNHGNRPDQHADGRGAGPDHNFRRGGRLPNEYRNRQYVVDDWRNHHLNAPPRGYHWVQTGSDYVLVAIATGVIAQILLGQ